VSPGLWNDLFVDGSRLLLTIFVILLPIVAGLELLRIYGVLARLRRPLRPLLHTLGLREQSADPFLTGTLFGMVYGSGVILARIREEGLPRRQVTLLAGILCMGHALPEDTLLFVGVGANGWLVVVIRILLLFAITVLVRALVRKEPPEGDAGAGGAPLGLTPRPSRD
jgi:spore maturation protein SpmB